MSAGKTTLTDLADIQISQLDLFVILAKEEIGAFDISMEDVHPMQSLQSMKHLDSHPPNFAFGKGFFIFLVVLYKA